MCCVIVVILIVVIIIVAPYLANNDRSEDSRRLAAVEFHILADGALDLFPGRGAPRLLGMASNQALGAAPNAAAPTTTPFGEM